MPDSIKKSRELSYYRKIRTGDYYWLIDETDKLVTVWAQRTGLRSRLSKADFRRQFERADR